MYQVITSRAEKYAPTSERIALNDASENIPAKLTEAVDRAAAMQFNKEYCALRYIASLMFSALYIIVKNNQLFSLREMALMEWQETGKCHFEYGKLPIVFCDL